MKKLKLLFGVEGLPLAALVLAGQALLLASLLAGGFNITFVNNWAVPGSPHAVLRVVLLGLWTTFFFLAAAAGALSFLPRRLGQALWLGLVALLGLHMAYRATRGAVFDPSLLTYNMDVFTHTSYWSVVAEVAGYKALLGAAFLTLLSLAFKDFDLFALPWRFDANSRAAAVGLAIPLLFITKYNRDFALADQNNSSDAYLLGRAVMQRDKASFGLDQAALTREIRTPYPLLRDENVRPAARATKPNIFVIMLESFPGELVEARLPDGTAVTPVLNGLESRGLFVRRFYSNSIQTAPAFTSIHCGLIPSFQKISTEYHQDAFRCLPEILKSAGYGTALYYPMSASFDNTKSFFGSNGFDDVISFADSLPDPKCSAVGRMGLRDDCIFDNVLKDLDDKHASGRLSAKKPVYATLLTTITHFDFEYPPGFPKLIPNPGSPAEEQINVAHLSDKFLGEFLQKLRARPYLRDSIVVIVGDHSFPAARQSGSSIESASEVGLTERHVWVPFFLLWPGHVPVRAERAATYSQIDIAPTVMSLLQFRAPNSFAGRSILAEDAGAAAPLVQPYSGKILGAVRYPYFYTIDERQSRETVELLGERGAREVSAASVDPGTLAPLKAAAQRVFLNEFLLKNDRVFPRAPAASSPVAGR